MLRKFCRVCKRDSEVHYFGGQDTCFVHGDVIRYEYTIGEKVMIAKYKVRGIPIGEYYQFRSLFMFF